MKKQLVKILTALLFLAAVLVSPAWVKDITEVKSDAQKDQSVLTIKGKSLENYHPVINTLKYDAMKIDQCY